jgi:hypothetical protein
MRLVRPVTSVMELSGVLVALVAMLTLASPAVSQQSIEEKARIIKETLMVLCLAGGSETLITAKGDLELRSRIKDILTGNIGAAATGGTQFSKQTWEGIIGGISKEMTAVQSQQANEARKCMVDNGFPLINKVLLGQ